MGSCAVGDVPESQTMDLDTVPALLKNARPQEYLKRKPDPAPTTQRAPLTLSS